MECRTKLYSVRREGRVQGHGEYHDNNNNNNTVEQSRLFGDQQI